MEGAISLSLNLSKIKKCFQNIDNKSTVIAISETWLNEEHVNMVRMEEYEQNELKGWGSRTVY